MSATALPAAPPTPPVNPDRLMTFVARLRVHTGGALFCSRRVFHERHQLPRLWHRVSLMAIRLALPRRCLPVALLLRGWPGLVRLTNLGISGIADPSDASLPSNKWSAGAGIRVQKADTIRMENLDIR